jgi:ATP-dependent DNA helicase RecG
LDGLILNSAKRRLSNKKIERICLAARKMLFVKGETGRAARPIEGRAFAPTMARRRFRNNQRHEPVTERSFQEYLMTTPAPQTSRTELVRLIRGGEDTFLELKVKLSNPERIAQEIVALANTGGGVIVFGVNDQMRVEGVAEPEEVQSELVRLCREEVEPPLVPLIDRIAFDNGRRVVALEVVGKKPPYRTRDGRFYLRIGSEKREATREELSSLLDETRPFAYENVPVPGATLADIDEAHLWTFVRSFAGDAFDESAAGNYATGEILKRDLLLGVGLLEVVTPTVAGLLLFGRDESVSELLPRATVTVTRYAGESVNAPVIEQARCNGNLFSIYESVWRLVERYCDLWDARPAKFPGADRVSPVKARANYHRGAVREGLVNALTHRDLAVRDGETRVNLFDASLEITNPRRTNGFMPAANRAIRYGVPQRLNPQLAALFHSPAYGLKLPSGNLPALLRESRLFAGRKTDLNAFNDEFHLRFYAA